MIFTFSFAFLIGMSAADSAKDFCKVLLAREGARYPGLEVNFRNSTTTVIAGKLVQFKPDGIFTNRRITRYHSHLIREEADREKLYEVKPRILRYPKLKELQPVRNATLTYEITERNGQPYLDFKESYGLNHHPMFRFEDDGTYYFGNSYELQFSIPIEFQLGSSFANYLRDEPVQFAATKEGEVILSEAFERAHMTSAIEHLYYKDRSVMNLKVSDEFAASLETASASVLEDMQTHIESEFGVTTTDEDLDKALEMSERVTNLFAKYGHRWITKAPGRIHLKGFGMRSSMSLVFPRQVKIQSEAVQFYNSTE